MNGFCTTMIVLRSHSGARGVSWAPAAGTPRPHAPPRTLAAAHENLDGHDVGIMALLPRFQLALALPLLIHGDIYSDGWPKYGESARSWPQRSLHAVFQAD